jgi:hypothetical protein
MVKSERQATAKTNNRWKTCSRGHKFRGKGPEMLAQPVLARQGDVNRFRRAHSGRSRHSEGHRTSVRRRRSA